MYPTNQEIAKVSSQIALEGKAFYKGFYITNSNVLNGWFMTTCERVVGETIEEVMYDINDTATASEYEFEVSQTNELAKLF